MDKLPLNALGYWRERHEMTRQELAERLRCTPEALRLWELGKRVPRPSFMTRIAILTNDAVQPNDFY